MLWLMKKMQRSELSLTIKLKKEMNRSALDCHVNYLQNKPQKAVFVPPPPQKKDISSFELLSLSTWKIINIF